VCTTAEGKSRTWYSATPPLPNVEFSRSEKEWQQLIQWDSLVVMPTTLLNEMLSAHCNRSNEAEKKEEKSMIFFKFLLSVRLD
jgi:hypothetical protein